MDRKIAGREIADLFLRLVNRYRALERIPDRHGLSAGLYHSERHILDQVGSRPEWNVTEHAAGMGVTKGAVSQVIAKLEAKGLVRRCRKGGNGKAVYLELTRQGALLVEKRRSRNEETLRPLYAELEKHPDGRIKFLIGMFRWLERYLEESEEKMRGDQT